MEELYSRLSTDPLSENFVEEELQRLYDALYFEDYLLDSYGDMYEYPECCCLYAEAEFDEDDELICTCGYVERARPVRHAVRAMGLSRVVDSYVECISIAQMYKLMSTVEAEQGKLHSSYPELQAKIDSMKLSQQDNDNLSLLAQVTKTLRYEVGLVVPDLLPLVDLTIQQRLKPVLDRL